MTIRAIPVLLGLVLGGTMLTACAAHPTACAGQCTAPYELDVRFRPALTPTQATAVLQRCSDVPSVVRMDVATDAGGEVQGRVYTTAFGSDQTVQPLFNCLRRQDEVTGAGFPD